MISMEELLTVDEVATLLKYKPETVTKLMRQRKLPGFKLADGTWRVEASELRKHIEDQKRKYQGEKPTQD